MEKVCQMCGRDEELHEHHIIKQSDGGNGRKENLISVCSDCHFKIHYPEKNNANISEFNKGYSLAIKSNIFADGWGILPNKIAFDNSISDSSKILYCIISSLCSQKGYCWASNKYLAKLKGASVRAIQRWLSELEKYIVFIDRMSNKRKIIVHTLNHEQKFTVGQKCHGNHDKNDVVDHEQSCIHNNKSINTLNYNIASNSKKILFDAENNKLFGYDSYIDKWKETYPALDIPYQISKMESWLMEHPKNRKNDYLRFMGNWFRRAQDSAPPAQALKKERFPV